MSIPQNLGRTIATIGVAGLLIAALGLAADTWIIVKQPRNGTCSVQLSTAHIVGNKLAGPYNTVKAANDALAAFKKNGTCAD